MAERPLIFTRPVLRALTDGAQAVTRIRKERKMLRPINDQVIVRLDSAEEVTAGGIIIPAAAQEKAQTGVVVAVGPGKTNAKGLRFPCDVELGERIAFGKYGATEHDEVEKAFSHEDAAHVVIPEDRILAVLEA